MRAECQTLSRLRIHNDRFHMVERDGDDDDQSIPVAHVEREKTKRSVKFELIDDR